MRLSLSLILLPFLQTAVGYTPTTPATPRSPLPSQSARHFGPTTRSSFLTTITSTVGASIFLPGQATASVFYDPDRYGDKELKIATVNKIRQNVRDAIVNKPYLAESILRVSLADSLTYNAESGEGGGNGCVLDWLKSQSPSSLDPMYKEAGDVLSGITGKLRKTTEVSVGDVVAMAGEEALESVGGERCRVQIGRLASPTKCPVFDFKPLFPPRGTEMGRDAIPAFVSAGLTAREAAIVAGVCGDVGAIVSKEVKEDEDEYVNEMGETDFIPGTSFGGPKEIYGKMVGGRKVGPQYLQSLNLSKKVPKGSIWEDDQVKGWGVKYRGGKGGLGKDAREGLEKVWGLGAKFTGGKVEALLGNE